MKKILTIIAILFTIILLTACGRLRRNENNQETDDYIFTEDIEDKDQEEAEPNPQPEYEEQPNSPEIIICENIPSEAQEQILRHIQAIENGDIQALLATFGVDGISFMHRHYANWLTGELISRYANTGLHVKKIEGLWSEADGALYIRAHIANNTNGNVEILTFFMDSSNVFTNDGYVDGRMWHIIRYSYDFGYQETLGFEYNEGILVDNRITQAEASLIHVIENFFNALEQGNAAGFIDGQTGISPTRIDRHFLDDFQNSGANIKKIEVVSDHGFFLFTGTVMVDVTVNHEAFGLNTIFGMSFEPIQRTGGGQMWRLSSSYISVDAVISGLRFPVYVNFHGIYNVMALNFIVNHYPAFFLDRSFLFSINDAHHAHRDSTIPMPKGMRYFALADEIIEPTSFAMYRLPDDLGGTDVFIMVVSFSSFMYFGQRIYGLFDGGFEFIFEYSRRSVRFWRERDLGLFMGSRTNQYYSFYTFDMDTLRDINEFWGVLIDEIGINSISDNGTLISSIEQYVGFNNLEQIMPIVSEWQDHKRGVFANAAIGRDAAAKSVEHITHPADRLILAVMGISIRDANRIAVMPTIDDDGEYGEWILIVDDNIYMFDPTSPRLVNFIGSAMPNVGGDIFWMEFDEETGATLLSVMEFIKGVRADSNR